MYGGIVADHIGQNPHVRHRGEDVYSILPSCHPTKGSDTHIALLEIYFHVFLSHNLGLGLEGAKYKNGPNRFL